MIDDPDYAKIFTKARVIGWQYGYAVMVHGSATRDLDIIAIPWIEEARDYKSLVCRIADACDLTINGAPTDKPHSRKAWTFLFKEFGDPRFVDFSVMIRDKDHE